MHEVDDILQIGLSTAQVSLAYFVLALSASPPTHLATV